jgi:signal transduction histidine kinase
LDVRQLDLMSAEAGRQVEYLGKRSLPEPGVGDPIPDPLPGRPRSGPGLSVNALVTLIRRQPSVTAWALTVTMGAVTLAALVSLPRDAPPLVASTAGWWMLAAAFSVTEARPIHIMTNRGAHTLNPIEIPLVISLALIGGPATIFARLVGWLLYAVIIRKTTFLKAGFNLAAAGVGAAVAAAAASLIEGPVSNPINWVWLLGGSLAGGVVTSLAVAVVLTAFDDERTSIEFRTEVGIATGQVAAGSMVGLAIVLPLAINLWTLAFSGVLILAFYAALAVYGRLRQRHVELEGIYAFTTSLDRTSTMEELVDEISTGVSRALKVRNVELTVDGDGGAITGSCIDGVAQRTTGGSSSTRSSIRTLEGAHLTTPLRSAPDAVIGSLTVSGREQEISFTDSDRRLLEAMASQAGSALSRTVVEYRLRGQVEHNQQLIRSKDQLIAAVSHELRTPLTGILGFAEILKEGAGDMDADSHQELAGSIAAEALDLSFIVEDLLTAARFELGQLTIKSAVVDIHPLVAATAKPFNGLVKVIPEGGQPVIAVATDPPRARQIVRNLISNAIKYGGPEVIVRIGDLGEVVAVDVCDNGLGVNPADSERIFLPYQTAHPQTTQPGAVGLGLPISRELARTMGGDVTYQREQGWTVFRLALPKVSVMPRVEQAAPSREAWAS